MKKLLITLVLAFSLMQINAQLLWKVSGKDCYKPSFLFGTIHLETGEYIDSVPGLNEAIESVDAIYGEIYSENILDKAAMGKIMKDVVAPADSTIDKLLTKDEYNIVDSVVRAYMMGIIGLENLKMLKPAVVYEQLYVMQMQKYFPKAQDLANSLDMAIQNRGIQLGKHVDGLESVDDQIKALFGTPLTKQAQDLVDFCRKDNTIEQYGKQLCDAYHAQDIAAIERIIFDPEMGMNEEEMETISYKRNRNWMEKIEMTLPVQSVLIAVGAAHLLGPEGLIQLLRDRGYTVEPVKDFH